MVSNMTRTRWIHIMTGSGWEVLTELPRFRPVDAVVGREVIVESQ